MSYKVALHIVSVAVHVVSALLLPGYLDLSQLCPTEISYWAKNYVTVLTRTAHSMTNFDLSKLNLVQANVMKAFES